MSVVVSGDMWSVMERVWLQTSLVPVTRPTHFNFYHSGALVTYTDITPDLPPAPVGDLSVSCPLIGHLSQMLSSDWLKMSLVLAQVLHVTGSWCHLATVTNINCNVRTLYFRQIYTLRWSLPGAYLSPFAMMTVPVVRGCSQARRHLPRVTATCITSN